MFIRLQTCTSNRLLDISTGCLVDISNWTRFKMDSQLSLPISTSNIGHAPLLFQYPCQHKWSHPWIPISLTTYTQYVRKFVVSNFKNIQNPNILHCLWSKLIPRTTIVSELILVLVFLSVRGYSQHKSQRVLGNTLGISTCWGKEWWEGREESIFEQREKLGHRVLENVTQSHRNLWNCHGPSECSQGSEGRQSL